MSSDWFAIVLSFGISLSLIGLYTGATVQQSKMRTDAINAGVATWCTIEAKPVFTWGECK